MPRHRWLALGATAAVFVASLALFDRPQQFFLRRRGSS
jgi:hypothetical protein